MRRRRSAGWAEAWSPAIANCFERSGGPDHPMLGMELNEEELKNILNGLGRRPWETHLAQHLVQRF